MILFLTLTAIITWSLWGAAALMPASTGRDTIFLLGTFAPGLVALALTARNAGLPGIAALLRRLVDWDQPLRWYLFALGYIVLIKGAAALAFRLLRGHWPAFSTTPWYLMLAGAVVSTLVGGQAGEELGWRGYALPRLATRFGLAPAGIILGVIWAAWHLPLFFIPWSDLAGKSFPLYAIQVSALSVAMTWLWVSTRGSLVPVMLLHASVNNLTILAPSGPTPGGTWSVQGPLISWLVAAALWVGAGWFAMRMSRRRFDASVVNSDGLIL